MLVDEGRLAREGDAWVVAGDLSGLRIPPTVSALLSSRLDRLPEGERSVLEAASVEGQSFSAGALEALLPEASRDALPGLLRSLARKDLVVPERRSGPGRDGYRFRHLLIRDAAYDAIPKSSRARLHLAFADWLEAAAGDALAEHREVLGHHLAQAHRYREELGLPDDPDLRLRAARALAEAGARAYDELGDARSAVRLLEIAVDLAPATEEAALWDERLWNIGFVVLGRPADSRPRDLNREVYGDEVADAVAARDARLRLRICRPLHHRPRGRPPRRPQGARAVPGARRSTPRARRPPEARAREPTSRATPRRRRRGRGRRSAPPRSWAGVTSSGGRPATC